MARFEDYRDQTVIVAMTFKEWEKVISCLALHPIMRDAEAKIGNACSRVYRDFVDTLNG